MTDHFGEFTRTVMSGLKEVMNLATVLCEAFAYQDKKHRLLMGDVQTLAMKLKDRDADVAALREEFAAFKRNRGWVQ